MTRADGERWKSGKGTSRNREETREPVTEKENKE